MEIFCYCSHTTIPRGVLAWICQNPETYKLKFHCRRQSGMNFGYVTVNEVNSSNISIFHVQHKNRKKYSFWSCRNRRICRHCKSWLLISVCFWICRLRWDDISDRVCWFRQHSRIFSGFSARWYNPHGCRHAPWEIHAPHPFWVLPKNSWCCYVSEVLCRWSSLLQGDN